MTTFSVFLAPLALLLPGASPPPHDAADPQLVEVGDDAAPVATLPPGWFALGAMLRPIANQVRIEQRVILRISPRAPEMQSMVSEMRRRAPNMHWEERKTGGCLPMTSLVGVRIGGEDQLVLYTRDRSMFRARLGDACHGRRQILLAADRVDAAMAAGADAVGKRGIDHRFGSMPVLREKRRPDNGFTIDRKTVMADREFQS